MPHFLKNAEKRPTQTLFGGGFGQTKGPKVGQVGPQNVEFIVLCGARADPGDKQFSMSGRFQSVGPKAPRRLGA